MSSLSQRVTESGYRLTPQRMMVIAVIESSGTHISAEDIYTQVRQQYPHVNVSTVYRTLELLKELGLVTETDLGEGRMRYHPIDKGHHHHLVCRRCGRITDLDERVLTPLKDTLRREYGFEADLRHLAILGHCIRCHE